MEQRRRPPEQIVLSRFDSIRIRFVAGCASWLGQTKEETSCTYTVVSKRTVGREGSAKLGAPARELGVGDLKKAGPEGRRRRCRGWPWRRRRRRPGGPPQLPPGLSLITGGRGDAGGSPVEATGGVVGNRRAMCAAAAARVASRGGVRWNES